MSAPPISLARLFAAEGSVRLSNDGSWPGPAAAWVGRLHRGRYADYVGTGTTCSEALAGVLEVRLPAFVPEAIDESMRVFSEVLVVGARFAGDRDVLIARCYVGGSFINGALAARFANPLSGFGGFTDDAVRSLFSHVRSWADIVRTRAEVLT